MASSPPLYGRLGTLSEPTRVRLLRLLAREEFTVGELANILQIPQPTISRHLKHLRTRGWIQRRAAGSASLVSMDLDELPEAARALWALVAQESEGLYAEDLRRMERILDLRSVDSSEFFGRHAGDWDALRAELFGDGFLLPTLLSILPPGLAIADLGCGTGATLAALAPVAGRLVGVDREAAMLEVARARLGEGSGVELLEGDLAALPLPDGELDIALCMLVLHHVRELPPVFSEIARALRPGGRLVILDMAEHTRESYRRSMGHRHLGFSRATLQGLARESGLKLMNWRLLPPDPAARGPSLFVAVAQRGAAG